MDHDSWSKLPLSVRLVLIAGVAGILTSIAGIMLAQDARWVRLFDNLHWTAGTLAAAVLARTRRRAVLLFGARTRGLLVGLGEARRRLGRAGARGGRLHLCTDDGSLGLRGDVVRLLDRVAPGLPGPLVLHACGPHAMLGAVARWALARDVPAFVAMESAMACGTGVCRGCALPRSAAAQADYDPASPSLHGNREWAMCCTEGPVFAAGDLDWERIP